MDMETCPYCGKAMEETLRAEEKSGLFVWYKCADDTCSGQSLKSYKIL